MSKPCEAESGMTAEPREREVNWDSLLVLSGTGMDQFDYAHGFAGDGASTPSLWIQRERQLEVEARLEELTLNEQECNVLQTSLRNREALLDRRRKTLDTFERVLITRKQRLTARERRLGEPEQPPVQEQPEQPPVTQRTPAQEQLQGDRSDQAENHGTTEKNVVEQVDQIKWKRRDLIIFSLLSGGTGAMGTLKVAKHEAERAIGIANAEIRKANETIRKLTLENVELKWQRGELKDQLEDNEPVPEFDNVGLILELCEWGHRKFGDVLDTYPPDSSIVQQWKLFESERTWFESEQWKNCTHDEAIAAVDRMLDQHKDNYFLMMEMMVRTLEGEHRGATIDEVNSMIQRRNTAKQSAWDNAPRGELYNEVDLMNVATLITGSHQFDGAERKLQELEEKASELTEAQRGRMLQLRTILSLIRMLRPKQFFEGDGKIPNHDKIV